MHKSVKNLLMSESPCSIGKIGSVELMHFYKCFFEKSPVLFGNMLAINAGINVRDTSEYMQWCFDFNQAIKSLDCLLAWNNNNLENRIIRDVFNGSLLIHNFSDLEPFSHGENGWHYSLKDKKVLVISSFKDSIEYQIKNFSKIWKGASLGSCQVIKSQYPYQITGSSPAYYNDIISNLKQEIKKADFDICIVGAGGYSLPICHFVKTIGKRAIHLGGAIQVLFGITGSRFDRNFSGEKWYGTEFFIKPLESDVPIGHNFVENSCYW